MTKQEVSKLIDHTLLTAYAQKEDIKQLCVEAKINNFASVCVNSYYVKTASELLKDSDVKVCTVIGFPLGAETIETKSFAASEAVKNGADEIDMVINISAAKDDNFDYVQKEIESVVTASKNAGKDFLKEIIVKVIIETCYLKDEEIVKACIASKNAKADFVKTSTGFGTPKAIDGTSLPNGASVYHVELMKKTVGDSLKVKASGSIRSVKVAQDLIAAGADRLGTSSGILIINNWKD